jgi:rubredoxin/Pyruvate/2-oxoacid:ferredoxin oxidoreductase delta subunit
MLVDDKRRRFLKHIGMVAGAGVLGLSVSQFASGSGEALINDLEASEQQRGYRLVWATKRDKEFNYGVPYIEYLDDAERLGVFGCRLCRYVYDVTEGRQARFDQLPPDWVCTHCGEATKADFEPIGIAYRDGGQPLVNEAACAFHYDRDGDGVYEDPEAGVYCAMPCRTICPVDAIHEGPFGTIPGSKRGPIVDFEACIGCGRCHKICGYNSIEWVNVAYRGGKEAG